ncbi:MAG TPA: ribosome recycling factor [Patescibacteria group bacterium]|nr:ribosome recycling factor [Patescibacteria group bacterium]
MHTLLLLSQPQFEEVFLHATAELGQLRTGRASPSLVEDLPVEGYGSTMALKGVASVSLSDARTLLVEPWDKALLKAIEKAIQASSLGVNPTVDGSAVRIVLPPLTEESRKQLVKVMREKLEDARVAARAVRERVREQVVRLEREKEIGEDEKFKQLDELDKLTKECVQKIDEAGERKEKEIMTV